MHRAVGLRVLPGTQRRHREKRYDGRAPSRIGLRSAKCAKRHLDRVMNAPLHHDWNS